MTGRAICGIFCLMLTVPNQRERDDAEAENRHEQLQYWLTCIAGLARAHIARLGLILHGY